jgi:hypothetical protein
MTDTKFTAIYQQLDILKNKISNNLSDEVRMITTSEEILRSEISDCINRKNRANAAARAMLKDIDDITRKLEHLDTVAVTTQEPNQNTHCNALHCRNVVMVNTHTGHPFPLCKEHYRMQKN